MAMRCGNNPELDFSLAEAWKKGLKSGKEHVLSGLKDFVDLIGKGIMLPEQFYEWIEEMKKDEG